MPALHPSTKMNGRRLDRDIADRLFSRAAGASLVCGNSVRVFRNADENYPAWLSAIGSAHSWIHFESYIIHDDEAGSRFAEALTAKAREGVAVRLLYDWMGALAVTPTSFWRSLARAGVDVRCFNPPKIDSPFGWLCRDHRKSLIVDGEVAFVAGLCVGDPGPVTRNAAWHRGGTRESKYEDQRLPKSLRHFRKCGVAQGRTCRTQRSSTAKISPRQGMSSFGSSPASPDACSCTASIR